MYINVKILNINIPQPWSTNLTYDVWLTSFHVHNNINGSWSLSFNPFLSINYVNDDIMEKEVPLMLTILKMRCSPWEITN